MGNSITIYHTPSRSPPFCSCSLWVSLSHLIAALYSSLSQLSISLFRLRQKGVHTCHTIILCHASDSRIKLIVARCVRPSYVQASFYRFLRFGFFQKIFSSCLLVFQVSRKDTHVSALRTKDNRRNRTCFVRITRPNNKIGSQNKSNVVLLPWQTTNRQTRNFTICHLSFVIYLLFVICHL